MFKYEYIQAFESYWQPDRQTQIHSESKKLRHYTFVHNFDKCWPIFKILSLLYSSVAPDNTTRQCIQRSVCHIGRAKNLGTS